MTSRASVTRRPSAEAECGRVQRAIREHLELILRSAHFDASFRSREFLVFVVTETLAGRGAQLNQASIAQAVFARSADFDPLLDPIVRVQAGRLRRSLERYYLLAGNTDPCRIELRRGSYEPVFTRQERHGTTQHPSPASRSAAAAPAERPAVLVHRFAVDSAAADGAELRLEDELARELCRYGDVCVIRRSDADEFDPGTNAEIRFELRGTLHRSGEDCLVAARLIDRSTRKQLWSDERRTSGRAGPLSVSVVDIARVMAGRIGAENGVIANALAAEYAAGRLDPSTAAGTIARCYHFFQSRQVADVVPLLRSLEQLTTRMPEFELAWVYLARLCTANHAFELSELQTPMSTAIPYAYQGVRLDPVSARARCILALALIVEGEVAAALEELEQTLRLNGESLAYREIIGWLLALAGEWERGVALMRETMGRTPYWLPYVSHGLWADHIRRGEFDSAYRAALEFRDQAFFWRELMIACSLGHLGRTANAQASIAGLLQTKPQFPARGRTLIGHYIKSAELRETIVEGLRRAGLQLTQ